METSTNKKINGNIISWLQIEMAKNKILPIYTLIEEKVGSHINSFKIRLKCNKNITFGVGSSKKEAKINAALSMLNLLYPNKNLESLFNNTSDNSSFNKNHKLTISTPNLSVNYIGKLQEFAVLHSDELPEYIHKNTIGEPHQPQFTIVCKYANIEVEATQYTKKNAKALAAEKMYNYVSANTIVSKLSQVNINKHDKSIIKNFVETDVIKYLKLRKDKLTTSKNINEVQYNESITLLKNKYSCKERELVMNILQQIIIKKEIFSTYEHTIKNSMIDLQAALDILKVKMEKISYVALKTYIYNIQLKFNNPNLILSEIAYGNNEIEAELNVIFHMALTLLLILI